ncbi:unnamed protein product [Rotaria sp. Silwood2]|nr:unnamed protein product [Rotaria sp. Silwood2]CAF2978280.1 unnamed protein product [Rotaria sp. Silwood2]CAF4148225.1 unnamed protein product [Rotaria sp. Silwood2]
MSIFPNSFSDNVKIDPSIKTLALNGKLCPQPSPFNPLLLYNSPTGWNAVLVGLLASILTIIFLLTCLYYIVCRRRHSNELSDSSAPVEQNGTTSIPITSLSQTAITTFINEPGKEIKMMTYTEQMSTTTGDFVGNGHSNSPNRNGLLSNGNVDPSELRLLQHEHQ